MVLRARNSISFCSQFSTALPGAPLRPRRISWARFRISPSAGSLSSSPTPSAAWNSRTLCSRRWSFVFDSHGAASCDASFLCWTDRCSSLDDFGHDGLRHTVAGDETSPLLMHLRQPGLARGMDVRYAREVDLNKWPVRALPHAEPALFEFTHPWPFQSTFEPQGENPWATARRDSQHRNHLNSQLRGRRPPAWVLLWPAILRPFVSFVCTVKSNRRTSNGSAGRLFLKRHRRKDLRVAESWGQRQPRQPPSASGLAPALAGWRAIRDGRCRASSSSNAMVSIVRPMRRAKPCVKWRTSRRMSSRRSRNGGNAMGKTCNR